MDERSLVNVHVEPRSTSRLSSALFIWLAISCHGPSSLFVWETRGKGLFFSFPRKKKKKKRLIACYFLSCLYFIWILFTWLKFTCVNLRSQKRVSGNHPLQKSRRNQRLSSTARTGLSAVATGCFARTSSPFSSCFRRASACTLARVRDVVLRKREGNNVD